MQAALYEVIDGKDLPEGITLGPGVSLEWGAEDVWEEDRIFLAQYYPDVEADKFYYLVGDECAPDAIWEADKDAYEGQEWMCVWTASDEVVFRLYDEGSIYESTFARHVYDEMEEGGAEDVADLGDDGAAALMVYPSKVVVVYPEDGKSEDVRGVILRQSGTGFIEALTYTTSWEAKNDFKDYCKKYEVKPDPLPANPNPSAYEPMTADDYIPLELKP